MISSRQKWEFYLILVTALWGWSFVAIHDSLSYLSDSAFNAYRFLSAALFLSIIFIFRRCAINKHDVLGGLIAGIALYTAFLFQTKGLSITSASNTSFITGLAVVFTPLFMWLFFKSPPTKQQIIGATLATIGLAVLTLKGLSIHLGYTLVCSAQLRLHYILLFFQKWQKVLTLLC